MGIKVKIQPLSDRLVIEVNKAEEKIGSIYIPENNREKPQVAKVIAIGIDVEEITVGDNVLIGKYVGSEIELDGHELLICKQEDILAIV